MIHRLLDRAGSRPVFLAAVVAVVALGAYLRFSGLTLREMWFDESCTLFYVQHLYDWPADVDPQRLELTTPAYTFLLRAWTRMFGEDAFGLRSFSAFTGCVTIVALVWAGRRMGGRFVGFAAAAIAAVHPLHIHYSQEARAYALWMLEMTFVVWMLHEAAREPKTRSWSWPWLGYGAAMMTALLTQYHSLFWLPATIACVIAADDRARCFREWLHRQAPALAAALLLWFFLVGPLVGRGSQEWLADTWRDTPPLLAIPKSLWAMLPSGGYPKYVGVLPAVAEAAGQWGGGGLALLIRWGPAVVLGVLAVIVVTRRQPASHDAVGAAQPEDPARRRALLYLVAFTLAALGVPFLYSLLVSPAYIVGRYDVAVWPAIVLTIPMLVQQGVRRLVACPIRGRVYSTLAVVVLAACGLMTTAAVRTVPVQSELAERASRLTAAVGEGDIVVALNMYRWHLYYELQRQRLAGTLRSYPSAHDRQIGWANAATELRDPQKLDADIAAIIRAIEERLAAGGRAWVLLQDAEGARRDVDMTLFAALRRAGLEVTPEDEWLGLGAIKK